MKSEAQPLVLNDVQKHYSVKVAAILMSVVKNLPPIIPVESIIGGSAIVLGAFVAELNKTSLKECAEFTEELIAYATKTFNEREQEPTYPDPSNN